MNAPPPTPEQTLEDEEDNEEEEEEEKGYSREREGGGTVRYVGKGTFGGTRGEFRNEISTWILKR